MSTEQQERHRCSPQVKYFEKKRENEVLKAEYIKKLEADGARPL